MGHPHFDRSGHSSWSPFCEPDATWAQTVLRRASWSPASPDRTGGGGRAQGLPPRPEGLHSDMDLVVIGVPWRSQGRSQCQPERGHRGTWQGDRQGGCRKLHPDPGEHGQLPGV